MTRLHVHTHTPRRQIYICANIHTNLRRICGNQLANWVCCASTPDHIDKIWHANISPCVNLVHVCMCACDCVYSKPHNDTYTRTWIVQISAPNVPECVCVCVHVCSHANVSPAPNFLRSFEHTHTHTHRKRGQRSRFDRRALHWHLSAIQRSVCVCVCV